MSHLILIRHSMSHQQPDVSSHEWTLTEEGIARCSVLADHLKSSPPHVIYSSVEPKAILTAESLAKYLMSRPHVQSTDGLEETHRKTAPYYKNGDDFRAAVQAAMNRPNEIVFGEEAFSAARLRLEQTLERLIQSHPDQTIAAVSHGTVMSMWLAPLLQRPVEEIWLPMGMPAYAVIDWPSKHVIHFQETLE